MARRTTHVTKSDLEDLAILVKNALAAPFLALSFLVPRRRTRLLFGSNSDAFTGNPKYLFLHFLANHPELDVAWVTRKRPVRDAMRRAGLPAYWKYEPKGLWYCLTARFWIHDGRPSDLNFFLSGGVVDVNLWHGIGIKGLGFNSTSAENKKLFHPTSLYRRLVKPWLHWRPSYFVSPSRLMTDHFTKAFRIPESSIWEEGYPRSDHFFYDEAKLRGWLPGAAGGEVEATIARLTAHAKVYLYMPTYRDGGEDFVRASGMDFDALQSAMAAEDALFVFKLHPWTAITLPPEGRYPNLWFAPRTLDMYPYLPFTDVLVTDYSSIYYDYLLLEKEVVLFVFDYAEYVEKARDLILDFDEYTPGIRATSFEDLMRVISSGESLRIPDHARIREAFWGGYDGDAAARIAERVLALISGAAHTPGASPDPGTR